MTDTVSSPTQTRSPQEWAKLKGHVFVGRPPRRAEGLDGLHCAAAVMHGWTQHEHDEQKPMQLTESEYEGALKALTSQPLAPHHAALSKHCKHKFDSVKKAGK